MIFNVGDRVTLLQSERNNRLKITGKTGTVVTVDETDHYLSHLVDLGEQGRIWLREGDLTSALVTDPTQPELSEVIRGIGRTMGEIMSAITTMGEAIAALSELLPEFVSAVGHNATQETTDSGQALLFKVGDKVKTRSGYVEVIEIDRHDDDLPYKVKLPSGFRTSFSLGQLTAADTES
jgi:hypothetical protein